jgi:hypothetical protein
VAALRSGRGSPFRPDRSPAEPDAISKCIGYAKVCTRSHHAVIRVYDAAGNVIETHERKDDFKELVSAERGKGAANAAKRDGLFLRHNC